MEAKDVVDWGSRIPAYAGLLLSVLALWLTYWRGRTRIKLFLGKEEEDSTLMVYNLSPHAVQIVSLGVVEADGSLSDWFDGPDPWPGLPEKIEARSQHRFTLHSELASFGAYQQKIHGRCGCFVRVAGGAAYCDPGWVGRLWWRLLNVFDKKKKKQTDVDIWSSTGQ